MERENQRITITKRLLKDSMLRLLKEKELEKISVSELCREAGINRATFYRHYGIPRDVLMEIQMDLYHELRRTIPMPTAPGEVKPTIEKLCAFMADHMDLLRIIVQSNTDSDFAAFINELYLEIWAEIGQLGALRNLNQEDARMLTLYFAGGSYFVMRHWLLGNVSKSPEEMAYCLYELMSKTDWQIIGSHLEQIAGS